MTTFPLLPLLDQEWIDSVNAERRKDGIDKVSYEIFEVVMDRLEKEWFDLVRAQSVQPLPLLTQTRPRTYRNQISLCLQKTLPVLSVTTLKEKTRTRSCSATDAI